MYIDGIAALQDALQNASDECDSLLMEGRKSFRSAEEAHAFLEQALGTERGIPALRPIPHVTRIYAALELTGKLPKHSHTLLFTAEQDGREHVYSAVMPTATPLHRDFYAAEVARKGLTLTRIVDLAPTGTAEARLLELKIDLPYGGAIERLPQ